MEGDSTGLEWENLALYSLGFSMPCSSPISTTIAFSSSKLPSSRDGFSSDLMHVAYSPETMIGLGLSHHKDDALRPPSSTTVPMSSPLPMKRSRASYHNMQNPCCQVEGCNLDLKLAKDYHRRHRICETHSKTPKVIVAGMERRFCQQCSRFHDLSEFDDKKRSCRRRLSDHNARRRRVQPESVQRCSPGLIPPALYDLRQQNVLLNGLPLSLPNSRHALLTPSKPRGVDGTLNFSFNDLHNLHMDPDRLSSIQTTRSNPRILDQSLYVAGMNSSMAPDLVSAHSLLSSGAWSMNEGVSEGIVVHGNYMRQSELDLFHTNNIGMDPTSVHHAVPSHHQQNQLFKDPYDSNSCYSAQRSL